MKFTIKDAGKPAKCDLLVLCLTLGADVVMPAGVDVPDGFAAKFDGEAKSKRATFAASGSAREVVLLGLGSLDSLDAEALRRAAAVAVKEARARKVGTLHIEVSGVACKALGGQIAGRAAAEGAVMAT